MQRCVFEGGPKSPRLEVQNSGVLYDILLLLTAEQV